jgi:hypothetical protein
MAYTTGYKDGSGNDLSTVFVHSDTSKKTSNNGSFALANSNTWWSINDNQIFALGNVLLEDTSNNIITSAIDNHFYYITNSVKGIYSIDMNIIYTNGFPSDSNPSTLFAFSTEPTAGGVSPNGIRQFNNTQDIIPGYISYNSSSRAVNNPNIGSNFIISSPSYGIGSEFYVHVDNNTNINYNFCTISSTIYLPIDTKLYFSFASNETTSQNGSFFINLLKAL